MSELSKITNERIIKEATAGSPGYPGQPYIPAYSVETTVTVCKYVWYPGDGSSGIPRYNPGSGYDNPTYNTGFYVWECAPVTTTITYPAQPYIKAVPAVPPTPAEIIYNLNIGWNSHSRTIDPIGRGEYVQYNLGTGITGAVIGVGFKGLDFGLPSQYTHALVADVAGVKLYESGVAGQELTNIQLSNTYIRIYRHATNNHLYYHLQKASGESIAVKSATPIIPRLAKFYVYAWLYTGGDRVPETDFLTGEVQAAQTLDV